MSELTLDIPVDIEAEIDQLISTGEYTDRREAVIGLLRYGLAFKRQPYPRSPKKPPIGNDLRKPEPPEWYPDHYR